MVDETQEAAGGDGGLESLIGPILELPAPARAAAAARFRAEHPEHARLLDRALGLAEAEHGRPAWIGAYRVLDVLGEGGMGTVYLAEQKHPVQRRVALKLIKLGMDTKAVLARFEAERQALALMDHSCIAKVFEAGATGEGRPYFVMEYVKGIPITRYCDDNRLSLDDRLALFRQVCSGVQHAHTKGVIHRDLTPNNVLVTVQDGKPTPKIIDFGLARATDHKLTEKTLFTEQGVILGTPEYMSPEQAGLNALDVDMRSDVYTLGVLLYELLSGRLPFAAEELRAAGYDGLCAIIRSRDPDKPSTKITRQARDTETVARLRRTDAQRLLRRLRGDLDWIVLKCLEKDRTRRYDTASELAADVQRHLDNEPVLARAPSVGYRMAKFARRYRGQVVAASLVLLALIAGVVGTAIGFRNAALEAEAARAAEIVAGRRADEASAEKRRADAAAAALRAERDSALRVTYSASLFAARSALASGDVVEAEARLAACPESLRGFEWHHLSLGLDTRVATLPVPGEVAEAVAFAPDGRRIAVAGDERLLVLAWPSGELLHRVRTPRLYPSLAWSPDGTRLVSPRVEREGGRSTLCIWDIDGERWARQIPQDGIATDVWFAPDGGQVFSIADDHRLRSFDVASGGEIRLGDAPAGARGIRVSPDGRRAAGSIGRAGELRVWEIATGREIARFPGGFGDVAWRTAGNSLAALAGRSLRSLDVETRTSADVAQLQGNRVALAGSSPDGFLIATVSDRALDLHDGHATRPLRGSRGLGGRQASFSSDGLLVAAAGLGTVDVWERATFDPVVFLSVHVGAVLAVDPSGTRIAGNSGMDLRGDAGGTVIHVLDLDSGTLADLRSYGPSVRDAAFLGRGELAVCGSDGAVRLWDLRTRSVAGELPDEDGAVQRLVASPLGGTLVTWSDGVPGGGIVLVWDAARRRLRHTVPDVPIWPLLAVDGERLAISSPGSSRLAVHDLDTGSVRRVDVAGARITAVELARDGEHRRAFALQEDGIVAVVDVDEGRVVDRISTRARATQLAVGSTPSRLAVRSGDDVLLFDRRTGERVLTLPAHGFGPLRFVGDGRRLFAHDRLVDGDPELARRLWRALDRLGRARWHAESAFAEVTYPELVSDQLAGRGLTGDETRDALAWVELYATTQCRREAMRSDADPIVIRATLAELDRDRGLLRADDDRRLLLGASTRGMALFRLGDFAAALESLDKAQTVSNAIASHNPANIAFSALTLLALGRRDDAETAAAALAPIMTDERFARVPEYRHLAAEVARAMPR